MILCEVKTAYLNMKARKYFGAPLPLACVLEGDGDHGDMELVPSVGDWTWYSRILDLHNWRNNQGFQHDPQICKNEAKR